MRALISVSDKTRLDAFAKKLQEMNIEIYSTEGTAKFLEERGVVFRNNFTFQTTTPCAQKPFQRATS